MQKKKVLHVLNTGSYSGAENVAITIINNTKEQVDGVYLSLNGTIKDVLSENEIEFYPVEKLSVKNIKKAISQIKPDIVHAHDFTAGIICSLSCGKTPVINHLHNNALWIKKFCVKSLAYAFSCLFYKKILTVSSSVMDEYIFGKFFKNKTKVISNPIDLKSIKEKGDCTAAEESDVIFLGRLSKPKNPLFFLEIVNLLKQKLPNVRVAMVGDGEMRKEVEKKIEELNLKETVTLYGFKKNPYPYLVNSKVLCIPSIWEGFGLVSAEALAFGKPVVASKVGGLVDIVNDSCGDFLTQKEEFATQIFKYLSDDDFYFKKSQGALKRSEELDNIHEYISELLALY